MRFTLAEWDELPNTVREAALLVRQWTEELKNDATDRAIAEAKAKSPRRQR